MKAIILAAGKGKRLRPLTKNIPKCLLPINGKPLLDYWLDICQKSDVTEILINGHYLADMLGFHIKNVQSRYSFKIHYVYEEKLLGTGGTVKNNFGFVQEEDFFLLCHGDNFTNIDVPAFVRFHKNKKARLSVALFKTTVPEQCGIIQKMDETGKILEFCEKPAKPETKLASAAIFLASPDIANHFPVENEFDFSRCILPAYQQNMYGFFITGYNIDIGTEENYKLANQMAATQAQREKKIEH